MFNTDLKQRIKVLELHLEHEREQRYELERRFYRLMAYLHLTIIPAKPETIGAVIMAPTE